MQVILLEKIRKLGAVGDQVKVKRGFGRNYLIPTGKAVYATPKKLAEFESRRAELEQAAAQVLVEAQKRGERLEQLAVVIAAKAAEEGKLFGSIGTREIAKAFADAGETVTKSEISLPEGAIRRTGEHPISLQLHSDVVVTVKVKVVAEETAQ